MITLSMVRRLNHATMYACRPCCPSMTPLSSQALVQRQHQGPVPAAKRVWKTVGGSTLPLLLLRRWRPLILECRIGTAADPVHPTTSRTATSLIGGRYRNIRGAGLGRNRGGMCQHMGSTRGASTAAGAMGLSTLPLTCHSRKNEVKEPASLFQCRCRCRCRCRCLLGTLPHCPNLCQFTPLVNRQKHYDSYILEDICWLPPAAWASELVLNT